MSPGDFERTFFMAGGSETKERRRAEEVTGESLGGALLWLPRKVRGRSEGYRERSEPRWGCY